MFLQKYWDVIGADVSSFCISCATLGTFPKSLNEKVLVLILKTNETRNVRRSYVQLLCARYFIKLLPKCLLTD